VTRFTLLNDEIKYYTNSEQTQTTPAFNWQGCVEARPYPYNVDDTKPFALSNAIDTITGNPATLFVPMFAPDEGGEAWTTSTITSLNSFSAPNSWWNDDTTSSASAATRQQNMSKYFQIRPYGKTTPSGKGPNYSCTTTPITPLTDVSTTAGQTTIKAAIDAMTPNGATNVPEGMAWGWRVLSSTPPFTEGRPETEKGNDKVVIVLTDGANTYYTPSSLNFSDSANNKSTYSALGYTGKTTPGSYTTSRMFQGAPSAISKTDYSNANYTKAMNAQFDTLCANTKTAGVIVMTVSLDLSSTKSDEKAQMDELKACSSDSRFRKDASGNPVKLYWNATGGSLADTFKDIANELSNLRIVS
jgi:hypothetical protein